MKAGHLDRRVQFLRAPMVDDGVQVRPGAFADLGAPVWAGLKMISDRERYAAATIGETAVARFTVRHSSFTAGITHADRLVCEGQTYAITGIKEIGRRVGFEITAARVTP